MGGGVSGRGPPLVAEGWPSFGRITALGMVAVAQPAGQRRDTEVSGKAKQAAPENRSGVTVLNKDGAWEQPLKVCATRRASAGPAVLYVSLVWMMRRRGLKGS